MKFSIEYDLAQQRAYIKDIRINADVAYTEAGSVHLYATYFGLDDLRDLLTICKEADSQLGYLLFGPTSMNGDSNE